MALMRPRPIGDAQAGDGAQAVGPHQRGVPSGGRAPVMADDDGLLDLERVEQAHHVADDVELGIDLGRLGPVALAIAAHVRRQHAKTG